MHTHLLARLGRREEATRLTETNIEIWARDHEQEWQCQVQATTDVGTQHDWMSIGHDRQRINKPTLMGARTASRARR